MVAEGRPFYLEIRPGVYEVRGNGEFPVRFLRGILNMGSVDCTAHVYRHEGGVWGGARGRQCIEFTLVRGRECMAPQEWFPPEEPLIVEIVGFAGPVTGGPREALAETADEPWGIASALPEDLAPSPDYPAPQLLRTEPATPQAASLFPGFVVSCERCRSVNISLTTAPNGRSYLECEECGTMCRMRLD